MPGLGGDTSDWVVRSQGLCELRGSMLKDPGLGKDKCAGGTGGGKSRHGQLSEEEFCARVHVANPRLGGTQKRGELGREMDVSWP